MAGGAADELGEVVTVFWLVNEKPRARKLFSKLLTDHDSPHQTWASPEWVNDLNNFE